MYIAFVYGLRFLGQKQPKRGKRRIAENVETTTDVECGILKLDQFEPLAQTHPRIKIVLFTNMALGIADRLRQATRAISVFDYQAALRLTQQ